MTRFTCRVEIVNCCNQEIRPTTQSMSGTSATLSPHLQHLLAHCYSLRAGTEIATESGFVQTAAPLVKSRPCMVILRLPRSTSTNR
jgi:hypothetical protein